MQLAQPQDHRPLPLLRHLDRIAQEDADHRQHDGDADAACGPGKRQHRAADEDDEDQGTDGIHVNLRCWNCMLGDVSVELRCWTRMQAEAVDLGGLVQRSGGGSRHFGGVRGCLARASRRVPTATSTMKATTIRKPKWLIARAPPVSPAPRPVRPERCPAPWPGRRCGRRSPAACLRALRGAGGASVTKVPTPPHHGQHAVALQFGIGALHGVEVDAQRHRDLAHGGKLARPASARPRPISARICSRSWT